MTNIPETGRTPRVQIRLVVIQILVLSPPRYPRRPSVVPPDPQRPDRQGSLRQPRPAGWSQPAVRGSILDARGVPIADNETRLVVSASRTDLMKMKDDGKAVLTKLAGVLDMKPEDVIQKVRLCDAKTPQPCWNGSPYQPIPITDEATAKQALQIRERSEDFPASAPSPRPYVATPPPARPTPLRSSAISHPSRTPRSPRPRTAARPTSGPTRSAAPASSASTTRSCAARPASPVTRSTTSAA